MSEANLSPENLPPDNLVLEHLKRIHADIAEMKRDIRDLKATNIVDLKARNISLMAAIGEMLKVTARSEERYTDFELRMERMEHHLNLEASPS